MISTSEGHQYLLYLVIELIDSSTYMGMTYNRETFLGACCARFSAETLVYIITFHLSIYLLS